jgi:hypothetical protein
MVLYDVTTHIADDGSQMQYQLSIVPREDICYMFCDKPSDCKETCELIDNHDCGNDEDEEDKDGDK